MDTQPYDLFLGEAEAGTQFAEGAQAHQEVRCLHCPALPCCSSSPAFAQQVHRIFYYVAVTSCLLCVQLAQPEFSQKFVKALCSTVPEQLDNSLLPKALQLDSIILVLQHLP